MFSKMQNKGYQTAPVLRFGALYFLQARTILTQQGNLTFKSTRRKAAGRCARTAQMPAARSAGGNPAARAAPGRPLGCGFTDRCRSAGVADAGRAGSLCAPPRRAPLPPATARPPSRQRPGPVGRHRGGSHGEGAAGTPGPTSLAAALTRSSGRRSLCLRPHRPSGLAPPLAGSFRPRLGLRIWDSLKMARREGPSLRGVGAAVAPVTGPAGDSRRAAAARAAAMAALGTRARKRNGRTARGHSAP